MTFDFFLETSKIVVKHTSEMTKAGLEEHAVERRQAISFGKEEEF